jgi:hypothetical protein
MTYADAEEPCFVLNSYYGGYSADYAWSLTEGYSYYYNYALEMELYAGYSTYYYYSCD